MKGWCFDLSYVIKVDKWVVIIGVGLVGLVCVDVLICNGVGVMVYDCHLEIGGLFIFGIFFFKLDKFLLVCCWEIFSVMGIYFEFNCEVGKDVFLDLFLE